MDIWGVRRWQLSCNFSAFLSIFLLLFFCISKSLLCFFFHFFNNKTVCFTQKKQKKKRRKTKSYLRLLITEQNLSNLNVSKNILLFSSQILKICSDKKQIFLLLFYHFYFLIFFSLFAKFIHFSSIIFSKKE